MSNNPYESPFPGSGMPAGPPQRPAAATVFGILNLVFAGLGLCGLIPALLMPLMPVDPNMPNPVLQLLKEDANYALFNHISIGLGFVGTIMLGAAGIGLLQMKPWGRQLSIGYALYVFALTILMTIGNYIFVFSTFLEKAAVLPAGPEKMGLTFGAYGALLGGCFAPVYPLILLIFMFTTSVKLAFAPDRLRPEDPRRQF